MVVLHHPIQEGQRTSPVLSLDGSKLPLPRYADERSIDDAPHSFTGTGKLRRR